VFPHHTKNKGDLAVLKAAADLAEQGLVVLWPCTEHAPFDLVAYSGDHFLRIQVRYVVARRGRMEVRFSTSYGDRVGSHRRPIDRAHVDLVAAYCPDTDECYYIAPEEGTASAALRIAEPCNGQRVGIRAAAEFRRVPLASERKR
jgi:hypothetical protein